MPVKYAIVQTHIPTLPEAYVARVQRVWAKNLDDVVDVMTQQGCTMFRADILGVLEAYYAAIETLVLNGENVNTPEAKYRASVQGLFDGPEDGFDPARHRIVATASAGSRLRAAVSNRAEVVKGEPLEVEPTPHAYMDVDSGERNSVLTPGGMGRLVGLRLKYDPADPLQGIFFLAADGSAARVERIGRNMPRELIFTVPALAAGEYTLEVRAIKNGGSELRSGALEPKLTVAEPGGLPS